jgi:hypothetical protein
MSNLKSIRNRNTEAEEGLWQSLKVASVSSVATVDPLNLEAASAATLRESNPLMMDGFMQQTSTRMRASDYSNEYFCSSTSQISEPVIVMGGGVPIRN